MDSYWPMTLPNYARRRSTPPASDALSPGFIEASLIRPTINRSGETETMNNVTVSQEYYHLLAEAAAQREGYLSARGLISGKTYIGPNDFFGTILCRTWLIDPNLIADIGAAYVSTLRAECAARDVTPPTVDEVLSRIPDAINEWRFTSVDVDALMRALARDIPAIVG
jgi:hypothetical protein